MRTQRVTPAWKAKLSLTAYRLLTRLYGANTPPLKLRRRFERLSAVSREAMRAAYPNVSFSDHQAGQLRIEGVIAVPSPSRTILYFHGGAFQFGSPASYRDRVRRLSFRCSAEVFVPDYRLAPEHPYPAAYDDALAAWAYVRALRPETPLVVAGDSAGGGLTLSLIAALRERGASLPTAAFAFSPWTDLSGTAESMITNARNDVWLSRRHIEQWGRHYAGTANATDPKLSPVHAALTGFPALLLITGDQEVLLDDTLRVEANARAAGVDVEVCIGRGMQHDFPLTLPWLEESREAWDTIVAFLDRTAPSKIMDTQSRSSAPR